MAIASHTEMILDFSSPEGIKLAYDIINEATTSTKMKLLLKPTRL